jgi:hypothetical protein
MTMPETAPIEPTALVPAEKASPLPIFTGTEMTQALTAYRDLQRALDQAMPDQIMNLDGKPFRKKGYWRAIAVAFNLTVEPITERREVIGAFDDGRENFGWHVTYRATTPHGRTATGDGSCFAIEKARRRDGADPWAELPKQASEHNVRSHAHTRAYNRAISNLVGFGEVSAEEVDREAAGPTPVRPKATALAKPAGYDAWLDDLIVTADEGTAKLQATWTASRAECRRYLTLIDPATWAAIKTRAAKVGAA